jgi:hypothetical protein
VTNLIQIHKQIVSFSRGLLHTLWRSESIETVVFYAKSLMAVS